MARIRLSEEFFGEILPMLGWNVPEDFDQDDINLLFEMCLNKTLTNEEAIKCVILLKQRAQSDPSYQTKVYSTDSNNQDQSLQEVNTND